MSFKYSCISPQELSFVAPVTSLKQLISDLNLRTPKKPNINASLKLISSSVPSIFLDNEYF